MRRVPMLVVSCWVATGCASEVITDESPATALKPKVMILGTYHMDNPGQDYANVEADDVLSPRRQSEIADLIARLARFEPTKIAVEYPASEQDALDAEYQKYLDGTYSLSRNEVDQIGYRLAAHLALPTVFAVDEPGAMDIEGAMSTAVANGQDDLTAGVESIIQTVTAGSKEIQAEGTVAEILTFHNSSEFDVAHGLYLLLAEMGTATDQKGAEVVAGWYERNLRVFSNIARLAGPDDRVLVIFGAGHGTVLRDFVLDHPGLHFVDAREFLALSSNE